MLNEFEKLKIELTRNGISLTSEAKKAINVYSSKDYGTTSGMVLRWGDIYANVPTVEMNPHFLREESSWRLHYEEKSGIYTVSNLGREYQVERVPVAGFLQDTGKEFNTDFAATHSDRGRISPVGNCAWRCDFCDKPFGELRYIMHPKDKLVQAVEVMVTDPILPAHHLLISGGTPGPRNYRDLINVYSAVKKSRPGLEVDVMMAPTTYKDSRLLDPAELRDIGIHALSVNLEFYNAEVLRKFAPQQARIGREGYFKFFEEALPYFPGKLRSNLIVGIESIEDTVLGAEEMAKRGVSPELSVFIPILGTPMEGIKPPSIDDQIKVYELVHEVVLKHKSGYPWLRMGAECVACMHNVLQFPDKEFKGDRYPRYDRVKDKTIYRYLNSQVSL